MSDPASVVYTDPGPAPRADEVAARARARMARFLIDEVNPGADHRDRTFAPIDRALILRAGRAGFLRFGARAELGGEGLDALSWGIYLEEMGYLCEDLSFPVLISLWVTVANTLAASGQAHLIERYARPMVAGERLVSFAYTEDADAFAFRTTAVATPGGYRLDGEKVYVTGGAISDAFMVYARTVHGDHSVFIVERSDPGVEVIGFQTHGLRATGPARLVLREVEIPADRLVCDRDGLDHAQRFLNVRRAIFSSPLAGRMRAIAEHAGRRLLRSTRYGSRVSDMPSVQATVGRMVASVETSRACLHRAFQHQGTASYQAVFDPVVSAAKYVIISEANRLALTAIGLAGGDGYTDRRLALFQRDAAGFIAGAGAQDILEVNLGAGFLHELATTPKLESA